MPRLLLIALFTSCVSSIVLPPLITPAPRLAEREAAENICGYYSLNGLRMFLGALFIPSRC